MAEQQYKSKLFCAGEKPNSEYPLAAVRLLGPKHNLSMGGGDNLELPVIFQYKMGNQSNYSFAVAQRSLQNIRRQTINYHNSKNYVWEIHWDNVFVNTLNTGVIGNNQDVVLGQAPSTLVNVIQH